jgi:hypothetical protein
MSISLCAVDFLDFFGDFASSAWPTLRRNAFITYRHLAKVMAGLGLGCCSRRDFNGRNFKEQNPRLCSAKRRPLRASL